MQSPFVRASCGCIVILLHKSSERITGMMECICLKPCDGESEWGFHTRPMEPWKVVYDHTHHYRDPGQFPRPLTEGETMEAITEIGDLVHDGYSGRQIALAVARIGRQPASQAKKVSPDE